MASEKKFYIRSEGNYNGYIIGKTWTNYYLYNSPSMYLSTWTELISWENQVYKKWDIYGCQQDGL